MSEYSARLSGVAHLMYYTETNTGTSLNRVIQEQTKTTAMNIDVAGKLIKNTITREVNNLYFRSLAQRFSTLCRWNYGQFR